MTIDLQNVENKRPEFARLFQEFAASYPPSTDGKRHIALYNETRKQARKNLDWLIAASERGEDVTEAVLFKLLPYADTKANRDKGMWVCNASAFTTDVRVKLEASGWTKPEDWPKVAQAVLHFIIDPKN